MVLSTHASVGAAIAAAATLNPVAALFAGFISHFLLDALPHADFPLLSKTRDEKDRMQDSMVFNKSFVKDLTLIGGDCLAAFLVAGAIVWQTPFFWPVMFGAVGAVLPDFLQFAHFATSKRHFGNLRWFHVVVIHTKREIADKGLALLEQLAIIVASFIILLMA